MAGVASDKLIFVRDVAGVIDGGEEPSQYVRFSDGGGFYPAVTIAVSKRKGTNAVTVAEAVLARLEPLRGGVIPSDVEMTITRHYGDTAKEKSNELLWHMLIAVVSVSVLIALTLGLESLIVFTAIPVTLALTLTVFYLYGYTLNRITLFALSPSASWWTTRLWWWRTLFAIGACRRITSGRHSRSLWKPWTR